MRNGIEPAHARYFKQQGSDQRKTHVHDYQDAHYDLGAILVVVLGYGRQLDIGEHELVFAKRRQDNQSEHNNAHAADPCRRHAPELQSSRQILHVVQDRCPRGSKSRDALEPCVDRRELAAPYQIREHAHDARHQPRTHDDAVSLLDLDLLGTLDEDQREAAQQRRQKRRQQQRIVSRIASVDKRHDSRHEHECRYEQQHHTDVSYHDMQSHKSNGFELSAGNHGRRDISDLILSFNSLSSSRHVIVASNGTLKVRKSPRLLFMRNTGRM